MKMNVAGVTDFIKDKWIKLKNSKSLDFKDFVKDNWGPKRGLLEFIGVYVIYEGNTPIYVGSAGKGKHLLKYRIADLFNYSPGYSGREKDKFYHTLTSKLVEEHRQAQRGLSLEQALEDVRDFYLKSCTFKVVKTDTIDRARMLEQAFILLLKHPKYNG